MSDSEEEAGGFGSEEEAGGFGSADEEAGGFSDDDDEDVGFGEAVEEDEEVAAAPAPPAAPKQKPGILLDAFAKKFFKNGNDGVYTIDPIKAPLLNVNKSSAKNACAIFRVVCQFMGITAKVGKWKGTTMDAAAAVIGPALKDDQLKDELYCQIMKQWTKNPAPNSRARGTILLALVIGSFAPSATLLPIVRAFILEGPKGFIPYTNLLLRRTLHNGQRMEVPCQLELTATKKKQILRIKVVCDLCTGMEKTARLDPASTADEWVAEIGNQLGLKSTFGWSIYMDRFGKLISLRGAGGKGMHIMDALSKADKEATAKGVTDFLGVTGQFSFRKEMFSPDHNSLKDPQATHLIMHQIQFGIKTGYFKPKSDQDYNLLAAQMYYSLYGDDFDAKRLKDCVGAWFPDAALQGKGRTLKDRLPFIEKLSAKGDFARKSFTTPQTEDLVIKYAMENWGKVDSFSSDNALMLMQSK